MPVPNLLWLLIVLFSHSVYANDCDYLPSPPDAERVSGISGFTAWYGGPTTRYGHGVLGDSIEATTLYVQLDNPDQCALAVTLEDHSVFEDITPGIADITGDGRENIITIESHADYGASLAIYEIAEGNLRKVAATPYIGRRFRWLAPIGTADFNKDGVADVALIQTPHLAGVMQIWSFVTAEPQLLASKAGFSNHRIGENFITGGIAECEGKPQIVVPDISWSDTMVVELKGNTLTATRADSNALPATIEAHLRCP